MKLIRNILLKVFSHQTLALLRWDLHFIGIRFINLLSIKKNKTEKKLREAKRPLYLNLGSGPRGLSDPHWINVDGYKYKNVMFCMDFNRKLPFPDNCFDGIFCEHVLEHFNLEKGQNLLRECHRIIQPCGCIRIIVPDGEKIIRTYLDNPSELLKHRSGTPWDGNTSCAMDAVNSFFRQRYEHQFIYDWKLLEHQLFQAGFAQISRVSFRKGKVSTAIRLDDEKYAWESLYLEAVKPTSESE
jgi:predicted SAM-dependent methyltransferase